MYLLYCLPYNYKSYVYNIYHIGLSTCNDGIFMKLKVKQLLVVIALNVTFLKTFIKKKSYVLHAMNPLY